MPKFILFYNGYEPFDNKVIHITKTKFEILDYQNTDIFSNFYPHKKGYATENRLLLTHNICGKDHVFPTSENAYQASKCEKIEQVDKFTTCAACASFKFGRQVTMREDWNDVKYDIMKTILLKKFTLDEAMKTRLLDTKDSYLIEHTPKKHRDKYWADDFDGTGQNNLGKCLMEVRVQLGGKPAKASSEKYLEKLYEEIKKHAMFKTK
jgi:ribA/ribD-fused uncharacterized protein